MPRSLRRTASGGGEGDGGGGIEWKSPYSDPGATSPGGRASGKEESTVSRKRIRIRYFKARFPDVPAPAEGSRDPAALIRAARLYFEDGEADRAAELLTLTSDLMRDQLRVLLAKAEIHYLARDGAGFLETARLISERFPGSAVWSDISRLGRRLLPQEPLFADSGVSEASAPDAPWPPAPNWMEAPREFSDDVAKANFRTAVLALSPVEQEEWQ